MSEPTKEQAEDKAPAEALSGPPPKKDQARPMASCCGPAEVEVQSPATIAEWFNNAPPWAIQQVTQRLSNSGLFLTLQIGPMDNGE